MIYLKGMRIKYLPKSKIILYSSIGLLISILIGFIGLLIILVIVARDLPNPDRVVRREGFATKIYDRNGELLYDVFDSQRRTPVKFDDIPMSLKQATIAVEDKKLLHPCRY